MTDAPRKRPLFQYHLSTLIVLTFVAAGLLWANLIDLGPKWWGQMRGAPWPFWYRANDPILIKGLQLRVRPFFFDYNGEGWHYSLLAVDAVLAILVLVGTAIALEWRIRHRERRP